MKKLKSLFIPFVLLVLSLPCPFIAMYVKPTGAYFIIFIFYCFIVAIIGSKQAVIYKYNILSLRQNLSRRECEECIIEITTALDADGVQGSFARYILTELLLEARKRGDKDGRIKNDIKRIVSEQKKLYPNNV